MRMVGGSGNGFVGGKWELVGGVAARVRIPSPAEFSVPVHSPDECHALDDSSAPAHALDHSPDTAGGGAACCSPCLQVCGWLATALAAERAEHCADLQCPAGSACEARPTSSCSRPPCRPLLLCLPSLDGRPPA